MRSSGKAERRQREPMTEAKNAGEKRNELQAASRRRDPE